MNRRLCELAAWVCAAPFIALFFYGLWLMVTHPVLLILVALIVGLIAVSAWVQESPRFADRPAARERSSTP